MMRILKSRVLSSISLIFFTLDKGQFINGFTNSLEGRIVGGHQAQQGIYPFYAIPSSNTYLCGGTLIHDDIVLTAAHCGTMVWESGVRLGATSLTSNVNVTFYNTTKMVIHPNYVEATFEHDIMLVKLNQKVPGPFATLNFASNIPKVNEELTAIGFGRTLENGYVSNDLLEVNFYTVSYAECSKVYPNYIKDNIMVCNGGVVGGGKDTCSGDSGGPVFLANTTIQIGLVSFGIGCARPDVPAVNTRISGFHDWITHTICELSDSPPTTCHKPSPPSSPVSPIIVQPAKCKRTNQKCRLNGECCNKSCRGKSFGLKSCVKK